MILAIPFMLFLIEWYPEQPGKFNLHWQPELYWTLEECEEVGADMVAGRKVSEQDYDGAQFEYYCMKIPEMQDTSDPNS